MVLNFLNTGSEWVIGVARTDGDLITSFLTLFLIYYAGKSVWMSSNILKHTTQPILYPKLVSKGDKMHLIIENHSSYPAYDLDVWCFFNYMNAEQDYKKIIRNPEEVKIVWDKDDEFEFYYISDRIVLYAFPPKSQCDTTLDIPIPKGASLIMQFRDSASRNYLYQSFFGADFPYEWKFNMTAEPKKLLREIPRIRYFRHRFLRNPWEYLSPIDDVGTTFLYRLKIVIGEIAISLKDRILIYLYIDKDYSDIFEHEFSSFHLKGIQKIFWEGRGEFTKLD